MDNQALKKIGLTDSEIKVYLSLLKLGSVTTGILTKETKLHKSRVYECLNRLIEKGLVGYVVGDFAKYFSATHPERLLDYLDERKKQIDAEKEEIQKIIPELLKEKRYNIEETEVQIFKGKEGLKTIHFDIIRNAKEILYIGAKGKVITEIKYFFENYERDRIKKNISQKFLCTDEFKETILINKPLTKYKYSSKKWDSKNVVFIYADKVIDVIWLEEPIAVMIKNGEVAKSYKLVFDLLWKSCE